MTKLIAVVCLTLLSTCIAKVIHVTDANPIFSLQDQVSKESLAILLNATFNITVSLGNCTFIGDAGISIHTVGIVPTSARVVISRNIFENGGIFTTAKFVRCKFVFTNNRKTSSSPSGNKFMTFRDTSFSNDSEVLISNNTANVRNVSMGCCRGNWNYLIGFIHADFTSGTTLILQQNELRN